MAGPPAPFDGESGDRPHGRRPGRRHVPVEIGTASRTAQPRAIDASSRVSGRRRAAPGQSAELLDHGRAARVGLAAGGRRRSARRRSPPAPRTARARHPPGHGPRPGGVGPGRTRGSRRSRRGSPSVTSTVSVGAGPGPPAPARRGHRRRSAAGSTGSVRPGEADHPDPRRRAGGEASLASGPACANAAAAAPRSVAADRASPTSDAVDEQAGRNQTLEQLGARDGVGLGGWPARRRSASTRRTSGWSGTTSRRGGRPRPAGAGRRAVRRAARAAGPRWAAGRRGGHAGTFAQRARCRADPPQAGVPGRRNADGGAAGPRTGWRRRRQLVRARSVTPCRGCG